MELFWGLADFPDGLHISFVQAFGVHGLALLSVPFCMQSHWHCDLLLGFFPLSYAVFRSYVYSTQVWSLVS